jgi:hypothetical protein
MDCRNFRRNHGAWVANELPRRQQDLATMHVAQCEQCGRFDAFTRRALMVARSAESLQVSPDFAQKLAARLAAERASMSVQPRHLDVPEHQGAWFTAVAGDWRARTPMARAAAVIVLLLSGGGAMLASRGTSMAGAAQSGVGVAGLVSESLARVRMDTSLMMPGGQRELVVLQPVHPVDGFSFDAHDPLQGGTDRELAATAVSATAPLWPTARMATTAAGRFAAMEFGDVTPVTPVVAR